MGVGIGVGVGVGVGVGIGVGVGVGVGVGIGVDVGAGVGVGTGVGVSVETGVGMVMGVGVRVGIGAGVGSGRDVDVGVGVTCAIAVLSSDVVVLVSGAWVITAVCVDARVGEETLLPSPPAHPANGGSVIMPVSASAINLGRFRGIKEVLPSTWVRLVSTPAAPARSWSKGAWGRPQCSQQGTTGASVSLFRLAHDGCAERHSMP